MFLTLFSISSKEKMWERGGRARKEKHVSHDEGQDFSQTVLIRKETIMTPYLAS
jgi:hypothetical protein